MNGYIIEKYSDMNNAYTSRRLCEEGAKRGIAMRIIGVYDVICAEDALFCGGEMLENADSYYLQNFRDSESVPNRNLHGYTKGELQTFADMLSTKIKHVGIRGVD